MSQRNKYILIGIALLLIGGALTSWIWDLHSQNQAYGLKIDLIKQKLAQADAGLALAKENLGKLNLINAQLIKRVPGLAKPKLLVKEVPADCVSCLQNYRLPIKVSDEKGYAIFESEDIFSEPGKITLTDKFDKEVIQPYRDASLIKPTKPKLISLQRNLVLVVAPGINRKLEFPVKARVESWPLRFGGKGFNLRAGAWVEADYGIDSSKVLNLGVFAGIKAEFDF
jgi:hypothetical protein